LARSRLLSSMGNKLAAVLRIKALWGLHCFSIAAAAVGEREHRPSKISTPVLSAPAPPELREAGLARSRLLSSMGNKLAAVLRIKALWGLHCCAFSGCWCGGAGAPAPKFLPPSCRPPILLSCEKLGCGGGPVFCCGGPGAPGSKRSVTHPFTLLRTQRGAPCEVLHILHSPLGLL
jgi:hypothetical protein